MITVRESERRAAQRRQSDPAHDREVGLNQHQVLTFREWCLLNKISLATGLLASGQGPTVTRLSARRIGITIGNNALWQQARAQSA
jgi:hypothetical protein